MKPTSLAALNSIKRYVQQFSIPLNLKTNPTQTLEKPILPSGIYFYNSKLHRNQRKTRRHLGGNRNTFSSKTISGSCLHNNRSQQTYWTTTALPNNRIPQQARANHWRGYRFTTSARLAPYILRLFRLAQRRAWVLVYGGIVKGISRTGKDWGST